MTRPLQIVLSLIVVLSMQSPLAAQDTTEKSYLDAVTSDENQYGHDNIMVYPALLALGRFYTSQQLWSKAEATYQRVIAIQEAHKKHNRNTTSDGLIALMDTYKSEGKAFEASQVQRRIDGLEKRNPNVKDLSNQSQNDMFLGEDIIGLQFPVHPDIYPENTLARNRKIIARIAKLENQSNYRFLQIQAHQSVALALAEMKKKQQAEQEFALTWQLAKKFHCEERNVNEHMLAFYKDNHQDAKVAECIARDIAISSAEDGDCSQTVESDCKWLLEHALKTKNFSEAATYCRKLIYIKTENEGINFHQRAERELELKDYETQAKAALNVTTRNNRLKPFAADKTHSRTPC
jgi:hypothetical protein